MFICNLYDSTRTLRNHMDLVAAERSGRESETMKIARRAEERTGRGALANIVLCPEEEISQWKQRSYSDDRSAASSSLTIPGERSRPRYSPSSSAFRFYILSFALFAHRLYVARKQKRRKSTPPAQIFLFTHVHLTKCTNFNGENNSYRLQAELRSIAVLYYCAPKA